MTQAPVAAETALYDMRVGSFNIYGVNNDPKASGDKQVWRERRPVVAAQILNRRLDVVGLQEANQSLIYSTSLDYGVNQYTDLLGEINHQGSGYALTNDVPYNCVRPNSSQNCEYMYRGASQDNRILYNTRAVEMVTQGSLLYTTQATAKNPRYLAWAIFRSKAANKEFLFTSTHLEPGDIRVRQAQWDELITFINENKKGRPVVAVGDFNMSKWATYADKYIEGMKAAGYGDVACQQAMRTHPNGRRADVLKRGWVNSYNGFNRNVRDFSYEDDTDRAGNGIDWIFASNELRVKKWEVVVDMDTNLMLKGVIPSDHNLVWANLVIGG